MMTAVARVARTLATKSRFELKKALVRRLEYLIRMDLAHDLVWARQRTEDQGETLRVGGMAIR